MPQTIIIRNWQKPPQTEVRYADGQPPVMKRHQMREKPLPVLKTVENLTM